MANYCLVFPIPQITKDFQTLEGELPRIFLLFHHDGGFSILLLSPLMLYSLLVISNDWRWGGRRKPPPSQSQSRTGRRLVLGGRGVLVAPKPPYQRLEECADPCRNGQAVPSRQRCLNFYLEIPEIFYCWCWWWCSELIDETIKELFYFIKVWPNRGSNSNRRVFCLTDGQTK